MKSQSPWNNATTHSVKLIQSLLNQLQGDVVCDVTYSPDLAPSDYHLIPTLKRDFGGRHFASEKDLQSAVCEFFTKQDAEWYSAGIYKLISCYNKCLIEQGDYVEK